MEYFSKKLIPNGISPLKFQNFSAFSNSLVERLDASRKHTHTYNEYAIHFQRYTASLINALATHIKHNVKYVFY